MFDRPEKTRVVDEPGACDRLGELIRDLGTSRVLLVTSPGLVAVGHVARAEASLSRAGLAYERFDRVNENPTTADVERVLAVARAFEPDVLLGFGGGSAIDAAKGANFLYVCGGRMRDYLGPDSAPRPLLPLVAVPTTAGTGTEVQSFALIADPETHQKMACGDPSAAPCLAVLDAELTLTMPREVTAHTGLDAIGHAVETAVSTSRNEVSSAYSRAAFELATRAFGRVLERPGDLAARRDMLRAAALAGLAIEHSMLGAAHSMANPLTARVGVPHGQAVGTALPAVVRFNAQDPEARAVYADLARAAGLAWGTASESAGAEALAAGLEALLTRAGLPTRLDALGVTAERCGALAAEAATQWTARFNPRAVAQPEFTALFEALVRGRS